MRQRPGTDKGIVFVTLEDEFGIAHLVIYTNVGERVRSAMIDAKLIVAKGRIERATEHANADHPSHLRRLFDRSDPLPTLGVSESNPRWNEANLGRADEVRRPNPGSVHPKAAMPASRDFRLWH
ncbi:hypothetical protein [Acidisoma silvae]|uniref:OB domain-containing protein n=1 Tax=Acidisoma silvae TaxID=2802396 RepID=A0A964E1I8_9PROT|nr:hypothetical protein [Acidisoma silvae]MCB8877818.1 hypothetical protein [Acidisoma silvae]